MFSLEAQKLFYKALNKYKCPLFIYFKKKKKSPNATVSGINLYRIGVF